MNQLPMCAYFTADPEMGSDTVSQVPHDAGEGPLFFFVPVNGIDAVRVPVCGEHIAILESLYSQELTL